ncbi:MAG: enoyl-CoA hydratase/isomerase family protein [Holophagaceae bacterium]|nr:enoyl-CoA hydratase/isomerase family protein [Holophagaceae bacterium]
MPELRIQRLDGGDEGIVLLGLDRSEAKNALGRQLLGELEAALESLRDDAAARVVILHSLVDGVFCAGADLKERAGMSPEEAEAFVKRLRAAFTAVERLPMPVLAVLEGAALGGGLELALACDLRVAGSAARLGLPETSLAIIPGAGGTQRLPRLIGRSKAKELIFTARRFSSHEALALGVVDRAVDPGRALDAALDLARQILPNGPVALRAAKEAIDTGMDLDREAGLQVEQACYAKVLPTEDRLEGLAAFREKRKPVYRGR